VKRGKKGKEKIENELRKRKKGKEKEDIKGGEG